MTFGLYFSLGNHTAHPGALWNLLGIPGYSIQFDRATAYTKCEASGVTFGLYFSLGNHIAHPGALWDLLGIQHTALLGIQHTRLARPLGRRSVSNILSRKSHSAPRCALGFARDTANNLLGAQHTRCARPLG